MRDLDRALADITRIRSQLAAGTMFRGFGPLVVAATGGLAFAMAAAQGIWPEVLARDAETFLLCWILIAVFAAVIVGTEMVARSRRHHGGLADQMIFNAVELFLPAGFAGAAIGLVFLRFAPQSLWMLPGLWQVLVGLGLFASLRMLPRAVSIVGGWYFIAGICVLIVASSDQSLSPSLSPWAMGLPFGIGQLLMAGVLHFACGEDDAEI